MDDHSRKRTRRSEERIYPILEMIESGSEEENDFTSSDENSQQNYEAYLEFDGYELPSEMDFFEEYDESSDQEMEEDEIDPDQLSYEDLIALGEMVGVESRGLAEAEINKHLQPFTFKSNSKPIIDRCVICQIEYEEEEKLVGLSCDHIYHSECITRWLQIKKSCPICGDEVHAMQKETKEQNTSAANLEELR